AKRVPMKCACAVEHEGRKCCKNEESFGRIFKTRRPPGWVCAWHGARFGSTAQGGVAMKFELPPLPYAKDALEPHLGAETLEYHYEKHHHGYLQKLEKLLAGKPLAERSLVEIIRESNGAVFNNAAQGWNHTFYWSKIGR